MAARLRGRCSALLVPARVLHSSVVLVLVLLLVLDQRHSLTSGHELGRA